MNRSEKKLPPNNALQRTRAPRSARRRSPLSFRPLGGKARIRWGLGAGMLVASFLNAAGPCRAGAGLVGPCFNIHGRLTATNGTPSIRIWIVGTKRLLGVVPAEAEIMPEALRRYVEGGSSVFADFEVCPMTPSRPGTMQDVCIQSATNVVIEQEGVTPRRVSRLSGTFVCADK